MTNPFKLVFHQTLQKKDLIYHYYENLLVDLEMNIHIFTINQIISEKQCNGSSVH